MGTNTKKTTKETTETYWSAKTIMNEKTDILINTNKQVIRALDNSLDSFIELVNNTEASRKIREIPPPRALSSVIGSPSNSYKPKNAKPKISITDILVSLSIGVLMGVITMTAINTLNLITSTLTSFVQELTRILTGEELGYIEANIITMLTALVIIIVILVLYSVVSGGEIVKTYLIFAKVINDVLKTISGAFFRKTSTKTIREAITPDNVAIDDGVYVCEIDDTEGMKCETQEKKHR